MPEAAPVRLFLTGSTGYVGGRLAPRLLKAGFELRCLVREARKLDIREWSRAPGVEVVQGDIAQTQRLTEQMRGCRTAIYLVHALDAGAGFEERDRELAASFAQAATDAGVERIVYLGGLGGNRDDLSAHLRSRRDVERILRESSASVTTLRAGVIIGSGSASFEVLRYVVERLPVMVTPKWVKTECQPIAIRDVLGYLIDTIREDATSGKTIEIGGPKVMPYRDLMHLCAEEMGLPRRLLVAVPVLSPRLSSLWIGLVTPVTPAIARPLIEGLRNRVVVEGDNAQRLLPRQTMHPREAIRRAIERRREHEVESVWSAAGTVPGDPDWAGGTSFTDERSIDIEAPADDVYVAVCRVGGGHGWYAGDWLWRLRGWMDRLVGGPGLRRGRRHPEHVGFGEALDFWRVVGIEPGRALRLRAEMKLPGIAELAFTITPTGERTSRLTMTARFVPRGLAGIAYWYAVLPLHAFVFGGMLSGIDRAARSITDPHEAPAS
ncbi:MAG: SDR family oxidoreductase [Planctomycetota bacterium]